METSKASARNSDNLPNRWALQNAKARFSELIRRVKQDGPQHVTVHGRDEVVVISSEEYRRVCGSQTGQAIIDAFAKCPDHDLQIEPEHIEMLIREAVVL